MSLSVNDVAKKLKVSEQHIRKLLRNNHLEAQMVGKQWIIEPKAVEKYIQFDSDTPTFSVV